MASFFHHSPQIASLQDASWPDPEACHVSWQSYLALLEQLLQANLCHSVHLQADAHSPERLKACPAILPSGDPLQPTQSPSPC